MLRWEVWISVQLSGLERILRELLLDDVVRVLALMVGLLHRLLVEVGEQCRAGT